MRHEPLTVNLPPELTSFVRREAEREDRSISAVVRRMIAEAAKHEAPAQPMEICR
jgi:Ribbon-helix-helix protein, copG family